MLLLALLLPAAQATDFLQADAGAAGMAVQVNILRDSGGFSGSELVSTDCSDIVVGPAFALDRAADPSSPFSGALLSTVFFIDDSASDADCTVYVDGSALAPFNAGIDNQFHIVTPENAPTDGGSNDADGVADGVITLSSSLRSDGGTLVLESLSVAAGETLVLDSSDPDSATEGNEAFLPLVLLVEGAVSIEGTLDITGADGEYADTSLASDGGDGGPGGGGGGVGGNCVGAAFEAGDGFTGGGGNAADDCTEFGAGGYGAAEGPDGEHGGEGVFTTVDNGGVGYAGGTGGGTGVPWGTGGGGGEAYVVSGDGGYGGGGGAGHCDDAGWGSGGGGFGSDGENGMGVLGGSRSDDDVGGAGLQSGDETLVPLAGGSGGAGGESGSGYADGAGGGGGGGALLLQAASISFGSSGLIDASGGGGGDTLGVNPGSSTGGGGGSGGGVHLAAASITGLGSSSLDLSGGYGGATSNGYESGDGGEGRLRVDGAEPPGLANGPSGEVPTGWQGAAIVSVADTSITISSSGSATLYIYDGSGAYVSDLSVPEDGTADLSGDLTGGSNHLVLVDDATGTISPAGTAVVEFQPDADGDGFDDATYGGTDCDDEDPTVNPDAEEICDGADNDCDGTTDEDDAADASTWYADDDGDSYGDSATTAVACSAPSGFVADANDCDDGDAALNPDTPWYIDYDGDGYGSSSYLLYQCEQPSGYVDNAEDCDDTDASAFPGGTEVCDGADNDCDGLTDDDDPDVTGADTWYADADADGFGEATSPLSACEQPSGSSDEASDCDDGDAAVNPDADELCNGADDDCDGDTDEDATDASTWYADSDGDGYGDADDSATACTAPTGFVANGSDCDDGDAAINPPASELCDGVDNDCDDLVDEDDAADAPTWYADSDGDGYGDPDTSASSCDQPSGYVADDSDCDDSDDAVNPDAEETWYDGTDQDCDGNDDDQDEDGHAIDDDCDDEDETVNPDATETWYDGMDQDCDGGSDYDFDGDGFDSASYDGDDCDDSDPDTYPGAPDDPYDGVINDCDNASDYDADQDGHTSSAYGGDDCDDANSDIHPEAEETWYDGVDQDCDGNDMDQDYDGHAVDQDCDDTDETVHPGAKETWYDGVDSDCAGDDDFDQDGDGWQVDEDCDDTDPDAWPGAEGWSEDCEPTGTDSGDTGLPQDSDVPADSARLSGDSGYGEGYKGGAGCGCAAARAAVAPLLLVLLGLVGLRRRR